MLYDKSDRKQRIRSKERKEFSMLYDKSDRKQRIRSKEGKEFSMLYDKSDRKQRIHLKKEFSVLDLIDNLKAENSLTLDLGLTF